MSFILDALKKAEAERQRQTGPTLLEVRVTKPRRRFPLWTLIIGGLLGVNILLLSIFALRRPAAVAAAPTPLAVAPAPTPAPTPAPMPAAPITAAAAAPAMVTAPNAPSTASTALDAPIQNPADLEPAVPARNANAGNAGNAGNADEPPSLSEISGDMPDLRLDLHVYAAHPSDRYALVNMHRVHEGDVLPEGPRVLAIERDGVKLSYRGTEFMLRPQ